jgi:CDGSH-type Zn-finger protein
MSECRVTQIPGGPKIVRGADVILDDDGNEHRVERPVVAVCACGLTQRAPWCDATHKVGQVKKVAQA